MTAMFVAWDVRCEMELVVIYLCAASPRSTPASCQRRPIWVRPEWGLHQSGERGLHSLTYHHSQSCSPAVSPAVNFKIRWGKVNTIYKYKIQNTKRRSKIFRYQFPVPCWRPRLETLTISLSSQAGALSPSDDMLTVVSLMVVVVVAQAQDNSLVPCQPHLELPCTHTDCISRHKVRQPVKALEAEGGTGTSYILHDSFPFFEYFNFSDKLALIEYQNNIHE